MATIVKNKDSLLLGLGRIYLAPAEDYLDDFEPVLSKGEYLGSIADIAFAASRVFIQKFQCLGNVKTAGEKMLIEAAFSLTANMNELRLENCLLSCS